MKRRAVLFDLDGTLLDTLADIADAMNAALAGFSLPVHPTAAYRRFVGDGVQTLARRATPPARRGEAGLNEQLARAFRERYAERWQLKTRPYPGVPELLDALTQRRVALAVLSNKPHEFALATVERYLARWPLSPVFGTREGVPKKPDPRAVDPVLAALPVPRELWLYVGDSNTDMRTARACNMTAVGVTWGFRDAEELSSAGAEHLIDEPAQLVELL